MHAIFLSTTVVLSIGNVGPLLDDGNKIYFNLTSYFNFGVDVEMEDPIAPQGASCMTGGIMAMPMEIALIMLTLSMRMMLMHIYSLNPH